VSFFLSASLLFGCAESGNSDDPDAAAGMSGSGGAGNETGSSGGTGGTGGTQNGGSGGAIATHPDAGPDASVIDARPPAPDVAPDPVLGIQARPVNLTCKPFEDRDLPPVKLSLTGCFDPKDPRKPGSMLIPYDVSSPLWSDGSEKARYFALPEGEKIGVKDCRRTPDLCKTVAEGGTTENDGKLDMPVGTVLVKTFAFAGKLHETRLFIRLSDRVWQGYSYEWRVDGSDADLVPDTVGGVRKDLLNGAGQMQTWVYPDRAMCVQCHTEASGFSLGVELRQLNTDYTYPSGITSAQLPTLEKIGVFKEQLMRPLPAPYPLPSGNAGTQETRTRSYLHSNCAMCHRPGGPFATMDFRFDTAFANMNLCNAAPERGNLGVDSALRLVPGKPDLSLVSLRMHALNVFRMPKIGSLVKDPKGVALVDAWITDLKACP